MEKDGCRIDLHAHTYPASKCSEMDPYSYVQSLSREMVLCGVLTNHGDLSDNNLVRELLAARGMIFIPGVEISTPFGDFLIFSEDEDFLASFKPKCDFPFKEFPRDNAVLVWAHPLMGGGMSRAQFHESYAQRLKRYVDAVEIYNSHYSKTLACWRRTDQLADLMGCAKVAGSDAHEPESVFACYTVFREPVLSVKDFIRQIKEGWTVPAIDSEGHSGVLPWISASLEGTKRGLR